MTMGTEPIQPKNGLSYADAGVDIDAGNALVEAIKPAVRSTRRAGSDTEIGGFGGLFDLKAAGFIDPVLVAANDGVGTKLRLAIEAGIHHTVGIDLVAMCVNDLVVQGAEPLFFLDYFATGKLDVAQAAAVVAGIAEGCRTAGCALIGGETAEMPGMYAKGDYDLAGFAVGAAERGQLLPKANIEAGDVLLGLASSGAHSNGFSLIRKVVELCGAKLDAPAPFATETSLGQALLTPTRIYVRAILAAIRQTSSAKTSNAKASNAKAGGIKAMAHITGGGFVDNIPRMLPQTLAAHVDLAKLAPQALFRWLARTGGISQAEMLRTFNCGTGMVVVVAPALADEVTACLEAHGESISRIGMLEPRIDAPVRFGGSLSL